jgi:hypothetical protein
MAMTLVLLLLVSMVVIYTARGVLFEQRVSANDFRSRQAFEAAESGLQMALAYIGSSGGADKDGIPGNDPVFDTNADGIGDSLTAAFPDSSSVRVIVGGGFPSYAIESTGFSDDRTATRIIQMIGSVGNALPTPPTNPLTARGTVVIGGSATVTNPEGNSTIWSGADVDLGSNNSTGTAIPDPTEAGYPTCMDSSMTCNTEQSSNRLSVGLDVIEHDTSLSNLTDNEMFANFFGMSAENYRASRVTTEIAAADVATINAPNGAGEIIWINGNTTIGSYTLGCLDDVNGNNFCGDPPQTSPADVDPSIIIIDGDLTVNGTPNITGFLFVTGNFNLTGNLTVMGAMVVAGTYDIGSGSLDIVYNSDVIEATRDNGPLGGAPGSWHDW